MKRRANRLLFTCGLLLSLAVSVVVDGQNVAPRRTRLAQLIEANVIAVHAYQILLAKKSGKEYTACYSPGKLSDRELEALDEHQARLLKADPAAVKVWARGAKSTFDPAQDLVPILSSGLTVPATAPVNVFTDYLRRNTKADAVNIRAVASLYQTVMEVERDGDRLAAAPDRANFVCLDGIHMKESYHRLMAKELLKFLAGEPQMSVKARR